MSNPKIPTSFLTSLFLVCASALTMAQQQPASNSSNLPSASQSTTQKGTATQSDERYRIGPGDILEVMVYNQPQLSRPMLRVDGRGMIRMPLLEGEIFVACKTESDLAKELTSRYKDFQKYPQVDVYIKEFNSQPVAVVGAVNAPGRFQLQRRVRLMEILTLAGGPSGAAGQTVQIVHAPGIQLSCDGESGGPTGNAEEVVSSYQIAKTLRADETENPFLRPGDVVTVPDADQIYVVGSVPSPRAIPLKEPLTLSKAIMLAGGVSREAEPDKIRIIRQPQAGGTKTELRVDLKAINKGTAQDIALLSNDVIEVPRQGGAKAILSRLVDSMVPMAMQLPLRIIY